MIISILAQRLGSPIELTSSDYPPHWNHLKKEWVAVISDTEDGSAVDRTFLGQRTNMTRSGANADIEYFEHEHPNNLELGTILEIKQGSHKNLACTYFRKDQDGWKYLGERHARDGMLALLTEDEVTAMRATHAEVARQKGLPELLGSEKQISWASQIRQKLLAPIEKNYDLVLSRSTIPAERLEAALLWLVQHDKAAWWIDNRYASLTDLICRCPEVWDFIPDGDARKREHADAIAEQLKKEAAIEKREQIRETIRTLFGEDYRLALKSYGQGDKRVYVGEYESNRAIFFADGNSKERPGTLKLHASVEDNRDAIREFLVGLCADWKTLMIN